MELLLPRRLQILPLNASVTREAARVVQLVIVPLTVRRVVDHVEGCRGKGLAARPAHETLFVVASGQTPVSGGDGFAFYGLAAAFAVAFGGCGAGLRGAAY
jgi:hypothetical protein